MPFPYSVVVQLPGIAERALYAPPPLPNDKILAFNFDLQSVLSTPKGATGPFFYVRKFAIYNLTIYNLGDSSVQCYMWDETEGRRSSIEIASCIFK